MEVTEGDVSNMLTQLKKSSDPAKQEMLQHYNSLSRYDKQKKELLGLWKGDKTCKWFAGWKKSVTSVSRRRLKPEPVLEQSFWDMNISLGFR